MGGSALTKTLEKFFSDYNVAFRTIDGRRIAPFYHAPCMTLRGDGSFLLLESPPEIEKFFQNVAETYKREGYSDGAFADLDATPIGGRTAGCLVKGRQPCYVLASTDNGLLADTAAILKRGAPRDVQYQNTTLVVVATNAALNKVQATKVAALAAAGVARTLNPPWTMFDGDVTFALSLGREKCDLNAVGVAAAEATAQSIVRAVQMAHSLAGIPGLAW